MQLDTLCRKHYAVFRFLAVGHEGSRQRWFDEAQPDESRAGRVGTSHPVCYLQRQSRGDVAGDRSQQWDRAWRLQCNALTQFFGHAGRNASRTERNREIGAIGALPRSPPACRRTCWQPSRRAWRLGHARLCQRVPGRSSGCRLGSIQMYRPVRKRTGPLLHARPFPLQGRKIRRGGLGLHQSARTLRRLWLRLLSTGGILLSSGCFRSIGAICRSQGGLPTSSGQRADLDRQTANGRRDPGRVPVILSRNRSAFTDDTAGRACRAKETAVTAFIWQTVHWRAPSQRRCTLPPRWVFRANPSVQVASRSIAALAAVPPHRLDRQHVGKPLRIGRPGRIRAGIHPNLHWLRQSQVGQRDPGIGLRQVRHGLDGVGASHHPANRDAREEPEGHAGRVDGHRRARVGGRDAYHRAVVDHRLCDPRAAAARTQDLRAIRVPAPGLPQGCASGQAVRVRRRAGGIARLSRPRH